LRDGKLTDQIAAGMKELQLDSAFTHLAQMHTTRDIAKGDKAIGPRGGEESMERDNRRKISVERSGGGT
jgi:glycerol-3-phosphate dehydrogenase